MIETQHYCKLYAGRHVDRYTLTREDAQSFAFNDCSLEGVGSQTIKRAVAFIGGYTLDGWSFQCGGPGYGFNGVVRRSKAVGYAEEIRKVFPSMPEAAVIETACRMEDTGTRAIEPAVHAHARHSFTNYDQLLKSMDRKDARAAVEDKISATVALWRATTK